jgi:hypothetical protein
MKGVGKIFSFDVSPLCDKNIPHNLFQINVFYRVRPQYVIDIKEISLEIWPKISLKRCFFGAKWGF